MGSIKDRNGMDLTEAEDIRRDGKNTQKNCTKKSFTTQVIRVEAASDFLQDPCSGHHSPGARGFQGPESQPVTCKLEIQEIQGKSSLFDCLYPFLENVLIYQVLCLYWACSRGQNQT